MYERYLEILEENNCKTADVARATNIHPSTFSDWKKGKSSPKLDKMKKLADFFKVSVDWLSGESEFRTKEEWLKHLNDTSDIDGLKRDVYKFESGTSINVYGKVSAGIPLEAIEDIIDTEEISEALSRTGEFFGLQIQGNSMQPRMQEGDNVVVRKQEDAESGDTVIALVNGHDAFCKRLIKYENGIALTSTNPDYEPKMYSNDEIENLPVKILGKVVELRAKY